MKKPGRFRRRTLRKILCAVPLVFQACLCSAQSTAEQTTTTTGPAQASSPVYIAPSAPTTMPAPYTITGSVYTQTFGGLNVTVDSRWCDGMGYRPLRISILPTAAVPADRDLIIRARIHHMWYYSGNSGTTCEQYITIPSGTQAGQAVTALMSLPPASLWSDAMLEVIDPALLSGTIFQQGNINGMLNVGSGRYNESLIYDCSRILFMGNAVPNTDALVDCYSQLRGVPIKDVLQGTVQNQPAGGKTALPMAIAFPMGEFPERWIDYTSLDMVCLSLDQLADLAGKRPAAYSALMRWVDSGGNLWVFGLSGSGGSWDRLGDLEKCLNVIGWSKPEKEIFGTGYNQPEITDPNETNQTNVNMYTAPISQSAVEQPQSPGPTLKPPPPPDEPSFLIREYGMGTVAAIASADPFSGKNNWSMWDWNWLLSTMGTGRCQWRLRHGLTVGQQNTDFWNFSIPGVGLAPVRAFQILITLFILYIGPINYWLLQRGKKLHLMVLTVPISAALVTIAMFTYALVADGFGARARVRSITRLDQRRGAMTTWARMAYYAGLTPSQGLEFSPDTAVYPILNYSEVEYGRMPQKTMVWENNQRLTQGWISSRTLTQFLTVRSAPSACRLEISEPSAAGDKLDVENRLGVTVHKLVIHARNGKYYSVENVGEGAKAAALEISPEAARSWLTAAIGKNQPAYPVGYDSRDWNNPRRRYYSPFGNSLAPTGFSNSQLESVINRLPGTGGLGPGISQSFNSDLPPFMPGAYVALVSKAPEIELGLKSVNEEAGFNLVLGEW
jgi:hypothetical protein